MPSIGNPLINPLTMITVGNGDYVAVNVETQGCDENEIINLRYWQTTIWGGEDITSFNYNNVFGQEIVRPSVQQY